MAAPGLRRGDPEEVGASVERLAVLRRRCAEWVETGETPAIVALLARRGVVVMHEAFGRLGPDEPALRPETLFPVASMTKPITAAAVLGLVEDGLVGLNRPVQEYVPELVGEGKEVVMLHHLLTHTSGMRDGEIEAELRARIERGELPRAEDVLPGSPGLAFLVQVREGLAAPLWKKPGEEMSYSNNGYMLLGLIVERVAGKPFPEAVVRRVLSPLGMQDSSFGAPVDPGRMIAWPRGPSLAGLLDAEVRHRLAPIGGLVATAWDLALFGQAFLDGGGPILSRATVREMTRNQIPGVSARYDPEYFPEASWGYGWDVQGEKKAVRGGSLLSSRAFGHSGAGGVYFWVDPEYELVGAFFSVLPEMYPGIYARWCTDLFINAATAAVAD
jgi:CubicO group peptidase (beta-lactamase class C family)